MTSEEIKATTKNILVIVSLFSLGFLYSQKKVVKYTDKQGWQQQILYYLTPQGKEYARVYRSLDKKDISRDSLAFYKTGIKLYTSDGYGYRLSSQIDYENPKKLKGEHFLLQHIRSVHSWDDLLYDNTLIKYLIGERKIKPYETFFDNQLKFETGIFGHSSYANYYSNTGLPFESDRNYKSIVWVKIQFNDKKKPIRLEFFLKKDSEIKDPLYKDFYYIREYFYKNEIVSEVVTTIKEVGGKTDKYTESYEVGALNQFSKSKNNYEK
jgi:hypothetical protein